MKLYYIGILRTPKSGPVKTAPGPNSGSDQPKSLELSSAKDLSSFSFFERSSVGQFMSFFADTVASRTDPGQRQSIEEGQSEYIFEEKKQNLVGDVIIIE